MAEPGFGRFMKDHREFFNALADEGWCPVPGYVGVEEHGPFFTRDGCLMIEFLYYPPAV